MDKNGPKLRPAYRGVNINRTSTAGYRLPWNAYINGQFISSDTLAGIKASIRAILSDSGQN